MTLRPDPPEDMDMTLRPDPPEDMDRIQHPDPQEDMDTNLLLGLLVDNHLDIHIEHRLRSLGDIQMVHRHHSLAGFPSVHHILVHLQRVLLPPGHLPPELLPRNHYRPLEDMETTVHPMHS